MSGAYWVQPGFAAAFALTVGITLHYRGKAEDAGRPWNLGRGRVYGPLFAFVNILPMLVLLWLLVPQLAHAKSRVGLLPWLLTVAAEITVYDGLLLLLLPLLRRRLRPSACAALWVLPNILYFAANSGLVAFRPLLTLGIPTGAARAVFRLWLAGFGAVFLWKLLGHFAFRFQLLRPSRGPGAETLAIWEEERQRAWESRVTRLRISPRAKTPLSIGLGDRRMTVVLPERDYAPEELRLILRHELVHIQRGDSWTKLYMVFCTALCWYNPLLWLAMGRAAEDVELGCDETVLRGAEPPERRRYAELLLTAAGDGRGFTTCLSASGRSLRYRLRAVLAGERKPWGAALAALLVFLLVGSFGLLAVNLSPGTLGEQGIPAPEELAALPVEAAAMDIQGGETRLRCDDPEALAAYVSGLGLYEDSFGTSWALAEGVRLNLRFLGEDGEPVLGLTLYENAVSVTTPAGAQRYLLAQKPDWAYLAAVLTGEN